MKLFRIIREIKNYFFLRRTIKKNRGSDSWKKHSLREGYFGVIWTVINLPPEVYESEPQYYQMYVIEHLKPVNEYLESMNLQEIITLRVEDKCDPEKGVYAFGVKYVPLFRELSLWWILKWTSLSLFVWWLQVKFDIASKVIEFLNWVFHFLKP